MQWIPDMFQRTRDDVKPLSLLRYRIWTNTGVYWHCLDISVRNRQAFKGVTLNRDWASKSRLCWTITSPLLCYFRISISPICSYYTLLRLKQYVYVFITPISVPKHMHDKIIRTKLNTAACVNTRNGSHTQTDGLVWPEDRRTSALATPECKRLWQLMERTRSGVVINKANIASCEFSTFLSLKGEGSSTEPPTRPTNAVVVKTSPSQSRARPKTNDHLSSFQHYLQPGPRRCFCTDTKWTHFTPVWTFSTHLFPLKTSFNVSS